MKKGGKKCVYGVVALLLVALAVVNLFAGCTNNAKQLGVLAFMYMNDTQYYMPVTAKASSVYDYSGSGSYDSLWDRVLISYLPVGDDVVKKLGFQGAPDASLTKKGSAFQSLKIFACPGDNIPRLSNQKDKYPYRSFGMSHAAGADGPVCRASGCNASRPSDLHFLPV